MDRLINKNFYYGALFGAILGTALWTFLIHYAVNEEAKKQFWQYMVQKRVKVMQKAYNNYSTE